MKRRARPSNALYSLIRLTTARRRSWTGCLVNPMKALQPGEPTPQQRRLAFADLKSAAVMNIQEFFKSRGAMKERLQMLFLLIAITLFPPLRSAMNQPPAAPIYVTLWFDTEDYILPQSDDAAKRLAETLTRLGVRATFKVVGEKARTLERRGRHDVIAALKKHDLGFHSDFHSVHPTPSEYLADCGFIDGVAEFARREGDGAAD